MEINKIYQGNNLDILKTFEDESIDCCVTSPPYYGLRDYGTAKWVGGDPNCPHMRVSKFSKAVEVGDDVGRIGQGQMEQYKLGLGVSDAIYKAVCKDCGAVREDEQIGLETTPEEYIENLVTIFREVRRVLKKDGVLWVNIGDTYYGSGGGRGTDYHDSRTDVVQSGNKGFNDMKYAPVMRGHSELKNKDLIGIPWMLAFALRKDGWYLRQDVIWAKPNPMPESVKDRCTKSHEYVFMLTKSDRYYFDQSAIQEDCVDVDTHNYHQYNLEMGASQRNIKFGGNKYGDNKDKGFEIYSGNTYNYTGKRNKRDVWTIKPSHYKGAHFATFPDELIYPMIVAGCPKGGIVLDPFMGSGTVGVVAKYNYRNYVGCELNPEYVKIAEGRIAHTYQRLF